MKIQIALLSIFFLFSSSTIESNELPLTKSDREVWAVSIKRVKMKPPCCGACKILTFDDSKAIWEYLTSSDPEKKKGKYLELWNEHKKKLLEEFKKQSPKRYTELYEK